LNSDNMLKDKVKIKYIFMLGIFVFAASVIFIFSPVKEKAKAYIGEIVESNPIFQRQIQKNYLDEKEINNFVNEDDNLEDSDDNEEIDDEKSNQLFLVTRVIDGDTIEIETGDQVRYIGINTPETNHPSKPVECFGKEATERNKELVQGQKIRLEKDVNDRDKYNRLLRYVYLEDDTFVNLILVEEGFATSYTYPPDISHQADFLKAENAARAENTGLWGECREESANFKEGECVIKGNISASGEKIYHIPGQYYYNQTVIDDEKGERWFCSEAEAVEAGWRKSKK